MNRTGIMAWRPSALVVAILCLCAGGLLGLRGLLLADTGQAVASVQGMSGPTAFYVLGDTTLPMWLCSVLGGLLLIAARRRGDRPGQEASGRS